MYVPEAQSCSSISVRKKVFPQPNLFKKVTNTFCESVLAIFTLSCSALWKTSNNRPFVKVQTVAGETDWLFDSGASVTCMSLKLFRQIPIHLRPEKLPSSTELVDAGGNNLNVTGVYNLKLTVHGKSIFTPVFVVTKLHSPAILGIDSISRLGIAYSGNKQVFFFDNILDEKIASKFIIQQNSVNSISQSRNANISSERFENFSTEIFSTTSVKIPPLCHATVCLNSISHVGYTPPPGTYGITHICASEFPDISSNSGLVQINNNGQIYAQIFNASILAVEIPRNAVLGQLEVIDKNRLQNVDKAFYLASIEKVTEKVPTTPPPSHSDREYVLKNIKISVPENEKDAYFKLLSDNLDVFSKHDDDLGCANHFKHKIDLNNSNPIYVKQFRIAEAYRAGLFDQIKSWLALGIIKPSQSKFNSPIFVVPKKNGKPRYVLDYRQLNKASVEDKYSMRTVDECIADIGYAGSKIFSIMDMSKAFHQMLLDDESSEYTSFTVPPLGQFKFSRTSMGLSSAPSNFQRMMELAMIGLHHVIVYFDDLLVHTKDHIQHRLELGKVFSRLRKCNLKLNPAKCHLGTPTVDYLGFRLTPQGILPGVDKLKCVRDAPPPSTITQIKQFLGLANFFRTHVRNFSLISSPLTKLTRKDTKWKGGPLPEDAKKAFVELKGALISEPCLAFPRSDRKFTLIVDSAIGSPTSQGGIGAILCQTDELGHLHPISYASRALTKHECNYSAFLVELTGCVFGIEHFSSYLKGRRFDLLTDHRPLVEKLNSVHSKTLNRLQQIMLDYDFEIKYIKGEIIPADYLSRNVLESVEIFNEDLLQLQKQDEFCVAVKKFLFNGQTPLNGSQANYIKEIGPQCFVENDILWRRMKRLGMPTRTVLVVPRSVAMELVTEAHGNLFVGHNGVEKCRERLLQSYFWPNMEKDIKLHLTSCVKCQKRKKIGSAYNYLQPMPQCTAPNQRVHIDLFGPLLSTDGKKYLLTATDAFTKYCHAWPINDKTAVTVAKTLFDNYFLKVGMCHEIFSDQGLEFNNKICDELCKLLQIKHNTTTAYRPNANSTAEIFNKTIAKYLSSFVDAKTKNWLDYVNPMLFAYNTSYHSTTKCTPFFLTYGHEARYPSNPNPDLQYHYGDTLPAQWFGKLQEARDMAVHNSVQAGEKSRDNFDSKTFPINYTIGQLVLLNEVNFLGRNRKLSPNWTGPYPILKIFESVVELKLPRRFIRVNVSRIKPYVPPVKIEKRCTVLPKIEIQLEKKRNNQIPNFDDKTVKPTVVVDPDVQPSELAPTPHQARVRQHLLWEQQNLPPAIPAQLPENVEPNVPPPVPDTVGPQNLPPNDERQFEIIPFYSNPYDRRRAIIPEFAAPLSLRAKAAFMQAVRRRSLRPSHAAINKAACKYVASCLLVASRQAKSPPPLYATNASDRRDKYDLPYPPPQGGESLEITKRREFLKKLSVQDRNLLLTGDPFFEFDPMVYSLCFFSPTQALPALLQNNFNYLIPNNIVVHDIVDDDNVVLQPYGGEDNVVDITPGSDGFITADDATDDEPSLTLTGSDSDSSGPSATKIFKPDESEYESSTTSSSSTNSEIFDPSYKPSKTTCVTDPPLPTRSTRGGQPSGQPCPSTSQPSSGMTASFFSGALSRVGNVVGRLVDSHPLASQAGRSSTLPPEPVPTSSAGSRTPARTTSTATRKRPMPSPSTWPKKT